MNEREISVPEIHCDHCKSSIEGAVTALAGVQTAVVDIPQARVRVTWDAPASFDSIKAAIEDQGYEVPAQSG